MLWRHIVKLIKSADELVHQPSTGKATKLNRPLQHLVPFPIIDSKHVDIIIEDYSSVKINYNIWSNSTLTRHRKIAGMNSAAIQKLIINENNDD